VLSADRVDGQLVDDPAAATLLGTLLLGRLLARLGPALLGPSYAERLARLEADTARANERNRLAREIHDASGTPCRW